MGKKLAYYGYRYLHYSLGCLKRDVDFNNIKLSEQLALLIFVAFTYEGFLNHAGHYVCSTWDKHLKPKLSPKDKMAFLCEVADVKLDYSTSPFQSFGQVMSLRNDLAHAKTEYIDFSSDSCPDPSKWPKPKWQTLISELKLEPTIQDLESVIKLLEKHLGIPDSASLVLMDTVEI